MYNAVWWIELSSRTACEAQDLEGTILVEKVELRFRRGGIPEHLS
ncbi:MAG: hypothetical protein WBX01_17680 [Nitrososphaeraceae archaeon]|jgi:hypothetical protein